MEKDGVWGSKSKEDKMGKFFKDYFAQKALKDILPISIGPT